MTLAVAAILTVLAFCFTLFVRAEDIPEPLPVSPIQHFEDRKYAIYDSLRDLQFEYRLGKLSDGDYLQNKQALQRELALVLKEMAETSARFGLASARPHTKTAVVGKAAPGTLCPHCAARFPQPLKFCGECGKAMS